MSTLKYEAGVWEQDRDLVVLSRHRTQEAAERAARRYARGLEHGGPQAGGALSWAGGWREIGGDDPTHWVCGDGARAPRGL